MNEEEQGEVEEPTEEPIERKNPDLVLLQAKIGGGFLGAGEHRGQISTQVAPGALLDAVRFLRDERGYKFLSFVCGVDCLELPVSYRFKVTYSLLNPEKVAASAHRSPLRGRSRADDAQHLRDMARREAP